MSDPQEEAAAAHALALTAKENGGIETKIAERLVSQVEGLLAKVAELHGRVSELEARQKKDGR